MAKPVSDRLLLIFAWGSSLILTGSLLTIIGFLLFNGYRALDPDLIFSGVSPWDALLLKRQVLGGLFPAMAGTLCLIVLSMAVAMPLGVASGIFLSEYAPPGIKGALTLACDVLAGIPSIVVGLFGFSITVFLHHVFSGRIYPCLLISALSLSFLVLPYITRSTQAALESIPLPLRLTAPGLGATRLQNIFRVLLPASLSGITSGIILAVGRCAEDTAVIMLTGAVATAGIPKSLFSGFEALPFYIYYMASEYRSEGDLVKVYGAALILLILCTALFFLAYGAKAFLKQRALYRY